MLCTSAPAGPGQSPGFTSFLPRGRTLILCLIPFAFLHGLFAALRWPRLWATSHMIIDYHFGIGKRGLFGTILQLVAPPPYHYLTLARIGFIVFALWLALLMAAAWRSIRQDTGMAAALVVFFLSAGFASLVDDMGYLEHFGLGLTLLCLLMPPGLAWLALRVVLAVAAVFLHEGSFLMLVPVIAFDAWVAAGRKLTPRAVFSLVAVMAPAAVAAFYIGNVKTACDRGAAMAYFQTHLRDFAFRPDALDVLCRNGAWNIGFISFMWRSLWQVYFLIMALLVIVPPLLFNMALIARAARRDRLVVAVATLAIVAPAALMLLGTDLVRFVSFMNVTSLLVLVSLIRRCGLPPGGTLPDILRHPAVLAALAAFELSTSLVLTDGSQMLKFPFVPLVQRLLEILYGHSPWLIIPPS